MCMMRGCCSLGEKQNSTLQTHTEIRQVFIHLAVMGAQLSEAVKLLFVCFLWVVTLLGNTIQSNTAVLP